MRTALKALQTWPSMLLMLQDAVFTFRPLSSDHPILAIQLASLEKRLSLPIWDTLPFCLHLSHAAAGFPQSPPLAKAAAAALSHFHAHIAALTLAERPLNGGQTIMANALTPILYPDPFAKSIVRRSIRLAPCDPTPTPDDIDLLKKTLLQLPRYIAFNVLKTISCGWTTSTRIHAETTKLNCIFGCIQSIDSDSSSDSEDSSSSSQRVPPQLEFTDSLKHYLTCKRLWRAINTASRGPAYVANILNLPNAKLEQGWRSAHTEVIRPSSDFQSVNTADDESHSPPVLPISLSCLSP